MWYSRFRSSKTLFKIDTTILEITKKEKSCCFFQFIINLFHKYIWQSKSLKSSEIVPVLKNRIIEITNKLINKFQGDAEKLLYFDRLLIFGNEQKKHDEKDFASLGLTLIAYVNDKTRKITKAREPINGS